MTSNPLHAWILAASALGALVGCAGFERGEPSPDAGAAVPGADGSLEGDGAVGPVLSFAVDVHPLLVAGCRSCHVAGGNAGSTSFLLKGDVDADRAAVDALIQPGNPAKSRLLTKASGQAHGGGAVYAVGSSEYATLSAWIAEGAAP
ncbi:MAG: hypothetical protein R3A78_15965 [Polyangiales bacterium]|nr:hypothetical protein [Myxococcales bacterium]